MEIHPQSRIWTEQDFNQLYEQPPKIGTPSTYHVIHLQLQNQKIGIKIPSGSDEQGYKYLISKSIYYFYLNKRDSNPLLKTAYNSFFQCSSGFLPWYQLWMMGKPLPKCDTLHTQNYVDEASIFKYKPLAVLCSNENRMKFLARSKQNGNYYNISIIRKQSINSQQLTLVHENYKQQHPFLAHLCEYHENHEYSYFIFEHHPYSLVEVLRKKNLLTHEQKIILFTEVLLTMIYLEQKKVSFWAVSTDDIFVNFSGHALIGEGNLTSSLAKEKNMGKTMANRLESSGKNKKISVLVEIFQLILKDVVSEEQKAFFYYLTQLQSKEKATIKQITNHSWIKKLNIQRILSNAIQNLSPKSFQIQANQKMQQISKQQIQKYFDGPYSNYFLSSRYQSYKISPKTINQQVIRRYHRSRESSPRKSANTSEETSQTRGLRKTSSSLSLLKRQRSKRKIYFNNIDISNKSPYADVLRKEAILFRKKNHL